MANEKTIKSINGSWSAVALPNSAPQTTEAASTATVSVAAGSVSVTVPNAPVVGASVIVPDVVPNEKTASL